jgi:hypothetical protein
MANLESTAVNELIDLVQSGKPLDDPGEDMFRAPPPAARPPLQAAPPPVPSMASAIPPRGEVEPLPPMRAPTGTSQLVLRGTPAAAPRAPAARAITAPEGTPPPVLLPPLPSSVRMVTAPPTRATTIPSLPSAKATLPPPVRASVPPPTRSTASTLPPATAPVAAPFETKAAVDDNPFIAQPVVAKPAPAGKPAKASKIDETGDVVAADGWFESSRGVDKVDETWMGTRPVQRQGNTHAAVRRLILPTLAIVGAGLAIGAYIGHHRHAAAAPAPAAQVAAAQPGTAPAGAPAAGSANAALDPTQATPPAPPAPAAVNALDPTQATPPAPPAAATPSTAPVAAAPAPAPAAAPAPTPAAAPAAPAPAPAAAPAVAAAPAPAGAFVDVRLDSRPGGATVMLVDNGKTTFLGTTPVAASLDPSRGYDVVFTLSGHPTQMAHIDPAHTNHLEVALDGAAPVASPHHAHASHATLPAPVRATHHVTRVAAAASVGAAGTLMVSSKPPCELVIDGRTTGLTTPQRAIKLAAGLHQITFVNAADHVHRTITVSIRSAHATKLIENLMH